MSGALKLSSEITLDQPDQAAARIFARQMYTILIHLREGRASAIVGGAPDHNNLEAWRLLHELWRSSYCPGTLLLGGSARGYSPRHQGRGR